MPGLEAYQAAASDEDGQTELRIPLVNGVSYRGWASIEPANNFTEIPSCGLARLPVRTMRIDRLPLGNVGFIKIDVEGHEFAVLKGLIKVLSRDRPNLIIEIRGKDSGGSFSDILQLMEPLRYRAFRLENGELLALSSTSPDGGNFIFMANIALESTRIREASSSCKSVFCPDPASTSYREPDL
jgi:FkbM family methyltransferase